MKKYIDSLLKKAGPKQALQNTAAVIFALAIWQTAAMAVGRSMLLASPLSVIKSLVHLIADRTFISTVLYSSMRISLGFIIAFFAGIFLAALSAKLKLIEIMLRPYVTAIKTVPVASFIILCLIWFSYSQLTVFISFLIAFPVIYSNVLQGIKSTPVRMTEVAALYRVSAAGKILYIYLPSVKPYLISACGISVGMAWKAGVAAEVIGVLEGSIGERLYEAKVYFQNSELLAWTVVIILLSVVGEKLFTFILRRIFSALERL